MCWTNCGGSESTRTVGEFLAARAPSKRPSQYRFAGTIRKRAVSLCSKILWVVTGLAALGTSSVVISSRAHERFANSAPMISGVLEKTIARRNPSRCKMRSNRSSKLTPHSSVNASGASATKIGRTFSIAARLTVKSHPAKCQPAGDDAVVFQRAEGREDGPDRRR